MAEPFASSHACIDRAKRHITELQQEIAGWVNGAPYTRVVETNAEQTEDTHKVKLTKGIPADLACIAGDALNNLRSALDQAGYTVGIANGRSGKKAHFPFGDTPEEVQRRATNSAKHIPKPIFDAMVALQPYEAGNVVLWALNKLCNSSKHEMLIPMGIFVGDGKIDSAHFPQVIRMAFPPRWDIDKNEMELFCVPHGMVPIFTFSIRGAIVIGKVRGVGGKPAVDVLTAMLAEVERSITTIESEARRIGLFPQ